MMPTRDHTRVQERQARIDYERGVERGSIEVLTDGLSRTTKTELCIDTVERSPSRDVRITTTGAGRELIWRSVT
jgi:hypothetical protein